jgi:hypothetical protein
MLERLNKGRVAVDPVYRFHESYVPEPNSGCWLWLGSQRGSMGYGSIKIKGKNVVSHRYSWEIHYGEIPYLSLVCHTCDNPACVNPSHLFLGSHKDNRADMFKKGRQNCKGPTTLKGESNPSAKLSQLQADEIRKSGMKINDLTKKYGVSRSTVFRIRNGKLWNQLNRSTGNEQNRRSN